MGAGSGGRARQAGGAGPRRALVLYLLAIVGPTLVLLVLGLQAVARQGDAIGQLSDANRRLRESALADRLEQRLRAAAEACLLDPEFARVAGETDLRQPEKLHAARAVLGRISARHRFVLDLFVLDASEVLYPHTEAVLPRDLDTFTAGEPVGSGAAIVRQLGRADALERQGAHGGAEAVYRAVADRAAGPVVRALAGMGAARCAEALGRREDAARGYIDVATSYQDQFDVTGRPIALVAAVALTHLAASPAHSDALVAIRQDLASGHWDLTAEEASYFAGVLLPGGQVEERFADRLALGRALRSGFRQPGTPLVPRRGYSATLTVGGSERQLFYAGAVAPGSESLVIGLSVDPAWITREAFPASMRELGVTTGASLVPQGRGTGTAFHNVLPWLRVELPRPPARLGWRDSGLLVFGATTLAVLGVLVLGVVLLLRDVTRQASASQLRADLVGGVSHELKTPLSVIRMYAETLADDPDQAPGERRSYYEVIIQESQRLSNLIERVLDFSRVDQGDRHYQMKPVRLGPVVRAVLERYDTFLRQQGFAVQTVIEDVPEVMGDDDAVAQAVVNLIENAVKYSADDRFLAVRVTGDDTSVAIEVEDHGLGVAPQHRAHVFARFYRGASRSGRGGYGLGLYLVKHLMDAHGGRVDMASEVDAGSTFRLIFPRSTTHAAAG